MDGRKSNYVWINSKNVISLFYRLREEPSPGDSLKLLFKNCPYLKKVFLAAIRGLSDRDLEDIADNCPHLEQLDLMGILGITTEMCLKYDHLIYSFVL